MTSNDQEITFEQGDAEALAFIDTGDIVNHLESLGYLIKDLSEWISGSKIPGVKAPAQIIIQTTIDDATDITGAKEDDENKVICWRYIE